MIRHYCDLCGNGMPPPVTQPEFRVALPCRTKTPGLATGTPVEVRIMRAIGGTWNGGHICPMCLATALDDVAEQLRGQMPASEGNADG